MLQLDGKKHSYLSSIFIRSKFKACLRFIKNKSIFCINFLTYRPGFFIKYFFNIREDSIENYNILENKNWFGNGYNSKGKGCIGEEYKNLEEMRNDKKGMDELM